LFTYVLSWIIYN